QLSNKKNLRQIVDQSIEQLEVRLENFQSVQEEQNHLKEVVKAFKQYDIIQSKLNQLNIEYSVALKHYEEAKRLYDLEEIKWYSNQAAILATKLVPGEPCPVCGSTEHQLSNKELAEMVDEKELKHLKQALNEKEEFKFELQANIRATTMQLESIINDLSNLNAEVEERDSYIEKYQTISEFVLSLQKDNELLTEQRKQRKKLLIEEQDLEQQKSGIDEQYHKKSSELLEQTTILEQRKFSIPKEINSLKELQVALNDAQNTKWQLLNQWEQSQKAYQEAQTNLATNKETFHLITQQVQELSTKLNLAKTEFKTALEQSGFENADQFQKAKRTELEQTKLYEQYMNYTKELHSLTTQVNEEKEQLKDKEKVDLREAEEQLDMLKRDYERALQHLNESKNYAELCFDYNEKLVNIATNIVQLEETSGQIVDLYNVLRGQNSKKISFERYVQMGFLEQITEAANIRLRNLSNGQFYLQCSDRQESHGRQSGLSLDVYDTYTGQSRDVKSLSGGEKFNASLCLALGMADVIQSYQGNVQIDTMFIDEGFGSLDEESLMKAIDTLIDLQKSGRMIGVISHVAELKAAMPAILQVEKLKEGYSKTSILLK
ncbi:MAG TPA: SbcC/MukB-like Walker B domain-containing protein, partial [Ureibacillus sp.]|nr:SbcC/MukB-like Walker B domain-containing protein [Ureibacillus sp.]